MDYSMRDKIVRGSFVRTYSSSNMNKINRSNQEICIPTLKDVFRLVFAVNRLIAFKQSLISLFFSEQDLILTDLFDDGSGIRQLKQFFSLFIVAGDICNIFKCSNLFFKGLVVFIDKFVIFSVSKKFSKRINNLLYFHFIMKLLLQITFELEKMIIRNKRDTLLWFNDIVNPFIIINSLQPGIGSCISGGANFNPLM